MEVKAGMHIDITPLVRGLIAGRNMIPALVRRTSVGSQIIHNMAYTTHWRACTLRRENSDRGDLRAP